MADNPSQKAPIILERQIRPTAENLLSLYYYIKQQRAQSLAQNWGAAFPNEDNHQDDFIPDGTTSPIINYNALAVLSVMDDFITWMEDGNRVNLLLAARKI